MSGFCVYGGSLAIARARAEKHVPLRDPETKRPYTEAEYRALVEEYAKRTFPLMKPLQISPAFDAPQFAGEWLSLASKTDLYRDFSIMCRGGLHDAKGNPKISKTTGQQLIGWVKYEPVPQRRAA
jgi:hypothetical protein